MIIIENDLTVEEGIEREKYWINYYRENSQYNVLNKTNGGEKGNVYKIFLTEEERKEKVKSYREAHKEEMRLYKKKYREEHKEEIRAALKEYHEAHKQEHNIKSRKYYETNRKEILTKQKEKRKHEKISNEKKN